MFKTFLKKVLSKTHFEKQKELDIYYKDLTL